MRVLYLEDDEDTSDLVRFMFALSDIDVVIVKTIDQAWKLAGTQTFDLYLLDGLLNGKKTLDLCRDLHEYAPYTPILFYSALAYLEDIQKGMAAGANGYLVKPYFGDLSETVMETVKEAESISVRSESRRKTLSSII